MKVAVRLPLNFDPDGLRADLDQIDSGEWVTHFNAGYFEGAWTGVALRATSGDTRGLYADPSASDYADTSVMRRCPHLAAATGMLRCPLKSVRLLKLSASSHIREHRDHDLGWDAGEVRLHVPIITHPEVDFFLNGQRVVMREGECWYLDLGLPHRVQNRGTIDRIHLVIDCQLNDWLRAVIDAGEEMVPAPPAESEFERFRQLVLGDLSLQRELMKVTDRKEFTALTLQLGERQGAHFTAGDVDAAFQAARRAWTKRAT